MRTRVLLLAAAAAVAIPHTADAQLGGFIKRKVGEKVADRAADKVAPGPPTHAARYTEATIGAPLDAATLDATLRGLQAMTGEFERAAALNREAAELSRGLSGGGADAARHARAASRVAECRAAFLDGLDHQRLREAERKIHHPSVPDARIERFEEAQIALQNDVTQLSERGDTAGIHRRYAQFLQAEAGLRVDPAADDAAATRQCGAAPPPPASLGARARVDSLRERARAVEREAVQAGVRASGLPAQRFNLARERLLTWRADGGTRGRGPWSPEERRLLESREAEFTRQGRALNPL